MNKDPFQYSIGTRVRDSIIARMMRPRPTDNIIDVGCGLGHFTHTLSQSARCTGIDVDLTCLEHCRKHLSGTYLEMDIREMQFPDASFDKALCSEVLEHILDNGVVLDEVHRVLRPGGLLVASVPCSDGLFRGRTKNFGHAHVDRNSLEYHHHKGYTLKQFTKLLSDHGFDVVDHDYTMVLFVEAFMMVTKLAVHALTGVPIRSQADSLKLTGKWYWKLYRAFFPLVMLMGILEQPLSRPLKGHMLIVKAKRRE